MILGMVVMAMCGLLYIAMATPHYRAHMIISPAAPMNSANVSSLMAGSDNFAMRYMVQNMGNLNAADFQRFENIYSGSSVALNLLQDKRIVDGVSQDRAFMFSKSQGGWSAGKLSEYINARVRLENVGTSPIRRLVYEHANKDFATFMLAKIHSETDKLIRRRIQAETNARIEYLQRSIRQTNNPDHRRALTDLLLEQERLNMLVSIESAYAASVIEPPSSSVKPQWPSKKLIMIVSAFVGLVIGFVLYNIRLIMRRDYDVVSRGGVETTRATRSTKRWQEWLSNAADNTNIPAADKPKRVVRGVLSSKDAAQ